MLAIPAAKCLGGLGDTSSLLKFLVVENGCEHRQVVGDITRLKTIRTAAIGVVEPTDQGQYLLLEYAQQLVRFLPQFANTHDKFQMNFVWADAFGSALTGTSNDFHFELACCVWNIGAYESLLGARLDRSNENAIRSACHRFQRAAGCFDYIISDILPKFPSIPNFPCLSAPGLKMARDLMMSQAQLCFYERAVQDMKKGTMKQSVVSKLAKQTSVYYYACAESCRDPSLVNVLDSLWLSVAEFQSRCFEGAAEYWQAQACRRSADAKNKGHGEDVVRYKNAERFVVQALENAEKSNLTGPLPSSVGTFLQAIRANQKQADENLKVQKLTHADLDTLQPLREISSVTMVVPSVTKSLTLLEECATPLFAFFDPSAPRPAPVTSSAIPLLPTQTFVPSTTPTTSVITPTAQVGPTKGATINTLNTPVAVATLVSTIPPGQTTHVGQKRSLPAEAVVQPAEQHDRKSGSRSGSSDNSSETVSSLSPAKVFENGSAPSAPAGAPGMTTGMTIGAPTGISSGPSSLPPPAIGHAAPAYNPSLYAKQPLHSSSVYQPPGYAAPMSTASTIGSMPSGPTPGFSNGPQLAYAPPSAYPTTLSVTHAVPQAAGMYPLASPALGSMGPHASFAGTAAPAAAPGQQVWYYALDYMGIPPQYPLYRLTETSFSIVSGGVLHEATSFNFDRIARRLRCHVFIWDFDIVFTPDMSAVESGVCLQHSDRARGIPRDFWTYQTVTDVENNKLHIVRCGPNGQQS